MFNSLFIREFNDQVRKMIVYTQNSLIKSMFLTYDNDFTLEDKSSIIFEFIKTVKESIRDNKAMMRTALGPTFDFFNNIEVSRFGNEEKGYDYTYSFAQPAELAEELSKDKILNHKALLETVFMQVKIMSSNYSNPETNVHKMESLPHDLNMLLQNVAILNDSFEPVVMNE